MNKTYFEIKRQYKTLKETVNYLKSKKDELKDFYSEKKPNSIAFMGSGSSYNVAESAEIIARMQFGIDSFSIAAGDAMVNFVHNKMAFEDSLLVVASRSGSTTEILNSVTELKRELQVPVVSITCADNSELDKISDFSLNLPWAFDESVCQTGTVTNLYAAVALTVASFVGNESVFNDFERMCALGEMFIEEYEPRLEEIAHEPWDKAVVLADGEISGLACEAALAFKEICGTMSNYYHVLDVRHGPMVLIDKKTLVLVKLGTDRKEYQLKLVDDLIKTGAIIIACTDSSYDSINNISLHAKHEKAGNIAGGLPLINIAQLVAYYKALQKGLDPGNPVGLDAWIKLD
jgi:glutamine---fructose-6-phosphate transaminase (isomerizing)